MTIVEIEPLVPKAASKFFSEQNFDVIGSSKVQLHIDDGRHFLLTTKEKFDAITVDPLDPWVKGAANLYTREFFDVAQGAPQSRRSCHDVHPAVRDESGCGSEFDRDILRSVSKRNDLGQYVSGTGP